MNETTNTTTNRTEELEKMLDQLTTEEKLEVLLFCGYLKENPGADCTPGGMAQLRAYYAEHGYFPDQDKKALSFFLHEDADEITEEELEEIHAKEWALQQTEKGGEA